MVRKFLLRLCFLWLLPVVITGIGKTIAIDMLMSGGIAEFAVQVIGMVIHALLCVVLYQIVFGNKIADNIFTADK